MFDYIDILDDAAKKRNPNHYQVSQNTANAVMDIIKVLRKYKIKTVNDSVHILASVLAIPIQILEQDPAARAILMRQLSSLFLKDILSTQLRDSMMKDTEMGNELDKLRYYAADSKTFFGSSSKTK